MLIFLVQKVLRFLLITLVVLFITLCILEVAYRYYWIDFYKTEFNALNKSIELDASKKTMLIFGDSFSAQEISYSKMLQDSLEWNIINLAVPGTCALQHELFAAQKIKKYKPNSVLFQVYVGNDLLDVSHTLNWKKVNFFRNMYWWFKDRFMIVGYLNYKLAQLKAVKIGNYDVTKITEQAFNPDLYDPKTKLLINADDSYIEKSVCLLDEKNENFERLCKSYKNIIKEVADSTNIYFLIIPDGTQTSAIIFNNYQSLGFQVNAIENFKEEDYSFCRRMKETFPQATVINPLKEMKEESIDSNLLYFKNDPHLNTKGQRLLYKVIQRDIEWN
jgi:hypothetical protein